MAAYRELRGRYGARSGAEIELLRDLLVESPVLETTMQAALQFILDSLGGESGALLIRPTGDITSSFWIKQGVLETWKEQFEDPGSKLQQYSHQLLEGRDEGEAEAPPDLSVAIPLECRAGRMGVLVIPGPEMSPQDFAWLEELIRPLARAIQSHHSFVAAWRHGREMAVLHRIATVLTSTLQLEEILAFAMEGIQQILDVEAGSLFLLDEEGGELAYRKTLRGEPNWIFQAGLRIGEGLVGECLRAGRPILVNDTQVDPRFSPHIDAMDGYGFETRSVLCAPLIAQGQTLGAIEVVNRRKMPFDNHDQDLLVSLAACVANAIYHAHIFHELTVANADLEANRWELLRSRNTLQALFDGITSSIYIIDTEYNLVAVNATCAHGVGKEPHELFSQRCYEALYHQTDPCQGCLVGETFQRGRTTLRNERRWGTSTEPMEFDVSTYPIHDESGRTIHTIVLAQDVTEKRRLETSLAQSEKLAAVGQLAAGVAHEINNPLAAIIANTQILQRQLGPEDEGRVSLDLIAQASERAKRVVRDLLDLARQDDYDLLPTDLNQTIRSAVALLETHWAAESINLKFDLAENLPKSLASRDHLQGLWLNLLLNARDALRNGVGEIQVASRQQDDSIHIIVSDTGEGIFPDQLPRIFEPFYTTKEPGHGTGLGLSTCRRIVTLHGGEIRVESQSGSGTAFMVILPIRHPDSV